MTSSSLVDEWERQFRRRGETPAVPAATVVLLRNHEGSGLETLMLRRHSEIAFGGMWVFPGGRIDVEDHEGANEMLDVARTAAVREAAEESGLEVVSEELVHFAFWVPPPIAPRRFATWFFAAPAGREPVVIDDGEITHHEWMRPADAIRRCDEGELELAPPTWVTLHTVDRYGDVDTAIRELDSRVPRYYVTHLGRGESGPVAMWAGDAGYDRGEPSMVGPRHRLEMTPSGYRFDESGYRDPS